MSVKVSLNKDVSCYLRLLLVDFCWNNCSGLVVTSIFLTGGNDAVDEQLEEVRMKPRVMCVAPE